MDSFEPGMLQTGAGIALLVWVIVEAVKRGAGGLSGRGTVLLAMSIGTALGLVSLVFADSVTAQTIVAAAITGLLGGATAVGIDATQRAARNQPV